jgi:hypothetical protein
VGLRSKIAAFIRVGIRFATRWYRSDVISINR